MGCDNVLFALSLLLNSFNPRTHVGCDRHGCSCHADVCRFQSTHPRGVRLCPLFYVILTLLVSIHAPTWGATTLRKSLILMPCVSIHAPTWGATDVIRNVEIPALKVSIHAPTWGATFPADSVFSESKFQSTHPRGVRHQSKKMREYDR